MTKKTSEALTSSLSLSLSFFTPPETFFFKKKKKKGCSAVSEYRRLLVSEHGRLDGASTEAIKVI